MTTSVRVGRVSAWLILASLLGGVACSRATPPTAPPTLQFVVTSDAHYGITRPAFRGAQNVDAQVVNQALVAALNTVPEAIFGHDGGLRAGEKVGAIDFVVETGDTTNRAEHTDELSIQDAATSWAQFARDYLGGLTLRTPSGAKTPLYVTPGNHEASNAVGFHRTMAPLRDSTPLIEIYNLMKAPVPPMSAASFDYQRDRFFDTRDAGGIHFLFLHVWPDSAMQALMEKDLSAVPADTPVVIFTHDQPDVEAKHFVNPNGAHDINATDQFENLLADQFVDGSTIETPSLLEQGQFEEFLRRHPNVTAYFHGNSNWHQAYEWNGPNRTVRLHTFRVDSPMKGAVSMADETKLSFAVVTYDAATRAMTVRECLWNSRAASGVFLTWGDAVTVAIAPRATSNE